MSKHKQDVETVRSILILILGAVYFSEAACTNWNNFVDCFWKFLHLLILNWTQIRREMHSMWSERLGVSYVKLTVSGSALATKDLTHWTESKLQIWKSSLRGKVHFVINCFCIARKSTLFEWKPPKITFISHYEWLFYIRVPTFKGLSIKLNRNRYMTTFSIK